jgi:hypothetical protein
MPHPVAQHPPVDAPGREADPWPFVVAIAVIGPLALAVALAVLAAFAG